jgi:hypothetical protein
MDTALQTLLSLQFIIFCLGITAITFVLKKVIDFFISKRRSKKSLFWSEVIVPILPVTLGGIMAAIIGKYPFPESVSSLSGRVFFGLVAGLLSGLVYRIVKSFLTSQIKTKSLQNNQ